MELGVRVSPEQMDVQALAAALAEVARQVAQMDIHQLRLEIISAARTREMGYIAVANQHQFAGTETLMIVKKLQECASRH
jgi:hypothetical protein